MSISYPAVPLQGENQDDENPRCEDLPRFTHHDVSIGISYLGDQNKN